MIVKGYYLTADNDLKRNLTDEQVKEAFDSKQGLLWVDIGDVKEEDGAFLERNFRFHHLAIEDCVSPDIHSPKIDDMGDYLFIIVHGIKPVSKAEMPETAELSLFLGSYFVVSVHSVPLKCVEHTIRMIEEDGRPMRHGTDFLAHALIDVLIDNILPVIDIMGETSEEIEEETGGKWGFVLDPIEAAHSMIRHIDKKRKALKLKPMLYEQALKPEE